MMSLGVSLPNPIKFIGYTESLSGVVPRWAGPDDAIHDSVGMYTLNYIQVKTATCFMTDSRGNALVDRSVL